MSNNSTDRRSFSVTWDYRCPFARNAHEHLVAALRAGADFDVRFVGFSLSQSHVEEGDTSVWDEPAKDSGTLAMQAGIAVRDRFPEHFLDVHVGLFALRHDEGGDLRDEESIRRVLTDAGADAELVFKEIEDGWPLETFNAEHDFGVGTHSVWGVPTFIAGGEAVFARLMTRNPGAGDGELGRRTIERILDLVVGMPELNEFKHTSISN